MGRSALLVLVGVAAFSFTAAALRSFIPLPENSGLRAKFDAWASHRDEYDMVFIGSSTLYRAIRPETVDAVLAHSGRPMRSINLAVPGMRGPEADALLDRILAIASARLQWIVIELPRWTVRDAADPWRVSRRDVYWHDATHTWQVVEAIWIARHGSLAQRLRRVGHHLGLFARWFGNVGFGSGVARGLVGRRSADEASRIEDVLETRGQGLREADAASNGDPRRRAFVKDRATFEYGFARRRRSGPGVARPAQVERYPTWMLVEQQRRIERSGRRGIYLVPARARDLPLGRALARHGAIDDLIDLNRPDEHPELFDVENFWDAAHLNAKGANIFSRLLGEELLERVNVAAGSAVETER